MKPQHQNNLEVLVVGGCAARYDSDRVVLTGWTTPDGHAPDGYSVCDYFADGKYLGPDQYGIEPIFAEKI